MHILEVISPASRSQYSKHSVQFQTADFKDSHSRTIKLKEIDMVFYEVLRVKWRGITNQQADMINSI